MKFIFSILLLSSMHSIAQITYPEKNWIQLLQKFTVSLGETQTDTILVNGKVEFRQYYYILGTGVVFYVKYKGQVVPVIVTAKHVLKNEKNNFVDSIRVRFSWHDDESVYKYYGIQIPLSFEKESSVFQHP